MFRLFKMLFQKNSSIEFLPTFLKEDRSFLRKLQEMISSAKKNIYMVYPWITLGEELVVAFENALSDHDIELFLITKLEKEDVFYRRQQLDDIEQWKEVFEDKIMIKYNNSIHAKMIIVDEHEVLLGSSNLTGSGLGSSREFEGYPQIEANIYTNNPETVQECADFFSKIWYHEDSKDYIDDEYVLECKSCHLSGLYQRYSFIFDKIANEEEFTVKNGLIDGYGVLGYMDEEKAYILGKNRKDIAMKVEKPKNLKNKIGDFIDISGKIVAKGGVSEFIIKDPVLKEKKNIKDLKEGQDNINITAEVKTIQKYIELYTKHGKRLLTLLEVKDGTGSIILELWGDKTNNKIQEGTKIRITNGYVKLYNGELRLSTPKNKGKIKILDLE